MDESFALPCVVRSEAPPRMGQSPECRCVALASCVACFGLLLCRGIAPVSVCCPSIGVQPVCQSVCRPCVGVLHLCRCVAPVSVCSPCVGVLSLCRCVTLAPVCRSCVHVSPLCRVVTPVSVFRPRIGVSLLCRYRSSRRQQTEQTLTRNEGALFYRFRQPCECEME